MLPLEVIHCIFAYAHLVVIHWQHTVRLQRFRNLSNILGGALTKDSRARRPAFQPTMPPCNLDQQDFCANNEGIRIGVNDVCPYIVRQSVFIMSGGDIIMQYVSHIPQNLILNVILILAFYRQAFFTNTLSLLFAHSINLFRFKLHLRPIFCSITGM